MALENVQRDNNPTKMFHKIHDLSFFIAPIPFYSTDIELGFFSTDEMCKQQPGINK